MGINAVFSPVNDILVDNKKISGSAQTRRNGILLQHGTVLYDLDLNTMFNVLNVSKQKITDKMIQNAKERVTCILKHVNVDKKDVYEALIRAFTEGKDHEFGAFSKKEIERTEELAEQKYRTDEWLFLR